MPDNNNEETDQISAWSPKNVPNALTRMTGGDVDETKANPRGENWWMLGLGYLIGVNVRKHVAKHYDIGFLGLW